MIKFFKRLGNTAKRAVYYDGLKEETKFFYGLGKELVDNKSDTAPGEQKTLEQIGFTGTKAKTTVKTFRNLLTIFLGITGLLVVYLIFNLVEGYYSAAIVTVAVIAMCLSQAFKYHFWLFQIKKGHLGCTWQDWLNHCLGRKKEK